MSLTRVKKYSESTLCMKMKLNNVATTCRENSFPLRREVIIKTFDSEKNHSPHPFKLNGWSLNE